MTELRCVIQAGALAAAVILGSAQASGAAPDAAALKFFEAEIRPLLVENCQECHGAQKHKGGLRLDNLPYILQGGENGPAIEPGKPDVSLLIKAVEYLDSDLEMPPDEKLPAAKIAALKKWVALGAPWPEAEVAAAKTLHKPGVITEEDRQWWAFQPVQRPKLPAKAKNAGGNPIDTFIEAKLAENGLRPLPEADKRELARRAYFDLHGLPPTPEQLQAFVDDKRPDAYERLIDGLLQSPRYGERWAQHWLDLVRYAESDGYRQDEYRPNAWRYRDYVIKSLNDDKPYDQFAREQLAGDEIAPDDPNVTIATAFLRHSIYEYNQRDVVGQWRAILNEVTDVCGDVFMGMSMQCAQCHDHKFDPILHKDYYRLQAFFSGIWWPEDRKFATPEEQRLHEEKAQAWKQAAAEPLAVIDGILEPRIARAQKSALEKFPEDIQAMFAKPEAERTTHEEQLVQLAGRQIDYERVRFKESTIKEPELSRLLEARKQLAQFDALKPAAEPVAFVISDVGPTAAETKYISRKQGEQSVQPGFLTLLDPADVTAAPPRANPHSSGRRSALADWIADPKNPLTTRVIVNRLWQYHFGRGIVSTASDFGRLGEKPSHPELLDWLTAEFLENGWKFKHLHKLIMTSAAYRRTSRMDSVNIAAGAGQHPEDAAQARGADPMLKDPENRLLWRFNPKRLDAEQARDAVLAVSGELDLTMGGEGVEATKPRRTVYTRKIRNTQDDFLRSLDAPPGFSSVARREATTTAIQSLLMVNGDWVLDRAHAMASRLLRAPAATDDALVAQAYGWAFSRQPTREEEQAAAAFLKQQRSVLRREVPPPPPPSQPLADAKKFFAPASAARTAKAMMMEPGTKNEKLRVNLPDAVEGDKFSVEAVVYLESLYPDASVRTVTARWNNNKADRGWAFGVTSAKSAYQPNNLIMQLCGEDFQGSLMYEVVASGIRIPVNTPYYVAASVSNQPAEDQKFGGTITFFARDLANPDAPMQTATVSHQICGGYVNKERTLYVGGREGDKRSLWHGAIARVALRNEQLTEQKLMTWAANSDPTCIADISADQVTAMLKAPAKQNWAWESSVTPAPKGSGGSAPFDPSREAVADLCHALLNANEFFYLH